MNTMSTHHATGAASHVVDISDAQLAYEEHGTGDPLLLLNGGFQSSVIWAGVVPLLATQFRVITPDSRGHGRSTNLAGRLSYQQLADDTVALMVALSLERPAIVGWSDGGQVVLEIGLRHPDAARTLIVGGAFFDFGEGFQGSVREIFGVDATGAIDVGRAEAAFGEMGPHLRAMHAGGEDQWHELLR
jgi:pimeloyl-ACP methyl ester carboxylesterase